jgi:hypothetical protein
VLRRGCAAVSVPLIAARLPVDAGPFKPAMRDGRSQRTLDGGKSFAIYRAKLDVALRGWLLSWQLCLGLAVPRSAAR